MSQRHSIVVARWRAHRCAASYVQTADAVIHPTSVSDQAVGTLLQTRRHLVALEAVPGWQRVRRAVRRIDPRPWIRSKEGRLRCQIKRVGNCHRSCPAVCRAASSVPMLCSSHPVPIAIAGLSVDCGINKTPLLRTVYCGLISADLPHRNVISAIRRVPLTCGGNLPQERCLWSFTTGRLRQKLLAVHANDVADKAIVKTVRLYVDRGARHSAIIAVRTQDNCRFLDPHVYSYREARARRDVQKTSYGTT